MNLVQTLNQISRICASNVHAGGPGSGCQGDRCGRPKSSHGDGEHHQSYSLKRETSSSLFKMKKTHPHMAEDISKELDRRGRKRGLAAKKTSKKRNVKTATY